MLKRWNVLDLFSSKDTAVAGQGPREGSTGASAGAHPSEGRRPAQRAAAKAASPATSSADTVVMHVRMRRPVIDAIAQAVEGSPIEFANASDFVKRAVEHELARRGLLKTFK